MYPLLRVLVIFSLSVGLAQAQILHRSGTGDPATLDPHKFVDPWEATIVMDLFIGLTTLAPDASVQPGSAESWTVSEDGLTYVFKLREGLEWSDGVPLTAEDFAFSMRRIVDPATASPFAARYFLVHNGREIQLGTKPPSELGVRALDERHLEVRLVHPTPFFTELMVHRGLPAPRHAIKKHGDSWIRPQNMVSNGAFTLREWIPNGHVAVRKNPRFYAAERVKLAGVRHHNGEDTNRALRQFRAGELDVVVSVPIGQLEWMKENLGTELHMVPAFGLQHYAFNLKRPPFNDRRVRRALAMAVNREVLVERVLGSSGESPAYGLIPPQARFYPEHARADFAAWPYAERLQRARALLAEAGFGSGNPLTVELSYNTHELHKRVAVAVAAMWKAIGVITTLNNMEAKVLLANMRQGEFDVGRYLWLAETSDGFSFLEHIHSDAGPLNQAGYANADYDALLDEIITTVDLDERAALLKQAEALALEDMPILPLYYYAGRRLIGRHVGGWTDNARGINLARDLSIDESLRRVR
jgi:oligopeptide transport system substrate-binding protein